MSDQAPQPEWRDNVKTAGAGSRLLAPIGIGLAAVLFFWTQFQASAQNEQNLLDELPATISVVNANQADITRLNAADSQTRDDIGTLRTGLAEVPDQEQVNRRDEEQTRARQDLEDDVDREMDQLRSTDSELEADLEILERELANLKLLIGRLQGATNG